jgi:hypothetical protein
MDIRQVLEDPLFQAFHQKLTAADYPVEQKKQIRRAAIRAMMEVRA